MKLKLNVAYLYLVPSSFFFFLFLLYPIFYTFYLSFFNWNGISPTMHYVGLGNYMELLEDPTFMLSLRNTIIWTILAIIVPVSLGLLLASLIDSLSKGKSAFLSLLAIPCVLSLVAVGLIWQFIYDPIFGFLNLFLKLIGLGHLAQAWLGNPSLALYAVFIAASWQYTPYCMLLFYAGLQGIPRELYEAASIDGATGLKRYFYITLPLLKKISTIVILITIIGSLRVFDAVYVMTMGGPGEASEVVALYLYKLAFKTYRMGYAAAMAVFLFILILAVAFIYIRVFWGGRKEVE